MCITPKGSTSYYILTKALKYLDQINLFERHQDGPTPFGLLDCYVSRTNLPFLGYINYTSPDGIRNCVFTLGTPNATDVWQLGDSSNQNVCQEMAMTVEKDTPILLKHRH